MASEAQSDIDEMLSPQPEPPSRPRRQYWTLAVVLVLAALVALMLLVVVLPPVARFVASLANFILRLVTGS